MPVVSKQLLRIGKYWTDDGVLDVTERDLHHLCAEGNRMLESGLTMPVPKEHQQSGRPVTLAERLANTVDNNTGWAQRLSIKKDGSLWGDLDIQDEEVAKKLTTTIKYISPNIVNHFRDGAGRVWKNVITHIALTTRPRFHAQEPFGTRAPSGPSIPCQSFAAAMSLVDAEDAEIDIALSMADMDHSGDNADNDLEADSNVKMVISDDDVAQVLEAQDLNRAAGKTADEMKKKWVRSKRFVLMEIPWKVLSVFDENPPGEVKTIGPIIIEDNFNHIGHLIGHKDKPGEALVLDGQHRIVRARELEQHSLFAYVGERALPYIKRAILDETPIGQKPVGESETAKLSSGISDMPDPSVPGKPSGSSSAPSAPSKPSGSSSAPSMPSGEPSAPSMASSKDAHAREFIELMNEHGIKIHEATSPKDLIEHAVVALRAVKGVLAPSGDATPSAPSMPSGEPSAPSTPSEPSGTGPGGPPSGIREEPPTAVAMSLEDEVKTLKQQNQAMQGKLSLSHERESKTLHTVLVADIDNLVKQGRVTPDRGKRWKEVLEVKENRLSLVDEQVKPAVQKVYDQIEMAKEIELGHFWTPEQKTKAQKSTALSINEEKPGFTQNFDNSDDDDPERWKKIADEQAKNCGLPSRNGSV